MKHLLLISGFLFNYTYLTAQCSSGELTGLFISYDFPQCEFTTVNINAERMGLKSGTFKFKFKADNSTTGTYKSLPQGWTVDLQSGFIYRPDFKFFAHNGWYQCIFTDSAGCRDTVYTYAAVNINPKAGILESSQCNGIKLTAKDYRNPSGTGNSYEWLDGSGNWVQGNKSWIYNGSGGMGSNQSLRIINAAGCISETYTGQLWPEVFTADIIGDRKIFPGGSTILEAESNYPVQSYLWYFQGTQMNVDSTAASVMVSDTGLVKLKIKSASTPSCNAIKVIRVRYPNNRIAEKETVSFGELVVYPNPASGQLNISSLFTNAEIYNQQGKLIHKIDDLTHGYVLDVSTFMPGIYMIRAHDMDEMYSTKFVIAR